MGDDEPPFADLFPDATPVEQDRVLPARPAKPPPRTGGTSRGDALAADGAGDAAPRFHRGGLQKPVLRRLRRGDIRPRAVLDLHGFRREHARQLLESFIDSSRGNDERCVLVIHGKGSRSTGGIAVLRNLVRDYLRDHPAVIAYCPAAPADGGEGAVYVYLRTGDAPPDSR